MLTSDSNSSREKIPTRWSGWIKSHNKFLNAFLHVTFNDNNTSLSSVVRSSLAFIPPSLTSQRYLVVYNILKQTTCVTIMVDSQVIDKVVTKLHLWWFSSIPQLFFAISAFLLRSHEKPKLILDFCNQFNLKTL